MLPPAKIFCSVWFSILAFVSGLFSKPIRAEASCGFVDQSAKSEKWRKLAKIEDFAGL